MNISRVWAMPHRDTFRIPIVITLLQEEMRGGQWADPFAGRNSPAHLTNDADKDAPTQAHLDGLEFLKALPSESVDGVLFDPPYSVQQALRTYVPKHNGTAGRAEYHARCHDEVARICRDGGKVIKFGWDSNGLGKKRGFELNRVLLICHGALHNDTIVTVEVKNRS